MKQPHPLITCAKELRNRCTDAERLLWRHLKNSQFEGFKFRRQQAIESYIVDFVSFDARLVIELDGRQHADEQEYDRHRDACLRANGFMVLRFWNNELFTNLEGVLMSIRQHCLPATPPTP